MLIVVNTLQLKQETEHQKFTIAYI